MRSFLFSSLLLSAFALGACSDDKDSKEPGTGSQFETWRGSLDLDGRELPFQFETESGPGGEVRGITIANAEERILLHATDLADDSLLIPFPIFESELRVQTGPSEWKGRFVNNARSSLRNIPFSGSRGKKERFMLPEAEPAADLSGRWEVEFVYEGTEKSEAVGIFEQEGTHLTGTFQTPTGDYRYLEGEVQGEQMALSCFDGAHAFLFHAQIEADGSLSGDFWSGRHWHETWTAKPNPDYHLPDPDSLTRMRAGRERLDFAFLDTEGNTVSNSDFEGQPLLVQVMGTWCPNCKDETAFLEEVYPKYKEQGLEIVAISFELSTDTSRAMSNLKRMQEHFDIKYPILFGGKAGPKTAGAALPDLEHVMSYPTTIFMDRNHVVQRIYTGFSGPAVKGVHEKLRESFEETLQRIVATGA